MAGLSKTEEKKIEKLRYIIHKYLNDQSLYKKEFTGAENLTTYCNIGAYSILEEFEKHRPFWNGKRIMLANEMVEVLEGSFRPVDYDFDFLKPRIYMAGWRNMKGHGHVAIIYPSKAKIFSAKWGVVCPLCANIGKFNGIDSLNWCFNELPDIYDLGEI